MTQNQLTNRLHLSLLSILLIGIFFYSSGARPLAAAVISPDGLNQSGCTREWYDRYAVVASVLEMDYWDLLEAVAEGNSIADVALDQNVSLQLVIDALVNMETDLVRKMERNSCLTAAEADAWIAELPERMQTFVEGVEASGGSSTIYLPILMTA